MPTESKARELCCPFKLNRPTNINGCEATGCMSWRWSVTQPARRTFIASNIDAMHEREAGPRPEHCPPSYEFVPGDEDPACWIEPDASYAPRRVGYCNLIEKD